MGKLVADSEFQAQLESCKRQIAGLKAIAVASLVLAVVSLLVGAIAVLAVKQDPPSFLQVEQLSAKRIFVHDADAGPNASRVTLYPGNVILSGESQMNTWLFPGLVQMNASGEDFAVSLALSEARSGMLTLSDRDGRKIVGMGQVEGDAQGMIAVYDPEGRYLRDAMVPRSP